MTHILFFDTETSGLPSTISFNNYHNPSLIHFYDSSRIIEIAYIICDKKLNIIKQESFLINNHIEIHNSHIHGISQELIRKTGVSIKHMLHHLYMDLIDFNVKSMIGHNVEFDKHVLLSEVFRCKDSIKTRSTDTFIFDSLFVLLNNKMHFVCTMKLSKKALNLFKFPKLIDLYSSLYDDTEFVQTHRAMSDTILCLKVYRKIIDHLKKQIC